MIHSWGGGDSEEKGKSWKVPEEVVTLFSKPGQNVHWLIGTLSAPAAAALPPQPLLTRPLLPTRVSPPCLHSQHYPWVNVSALSRYPPPADMDIWGWEVHHRSTGRRAAAHLPTHSSLLCHLPSLMAAQAADVSRLECSGEGRGGTHSTGTQEDPPPLLEVPHPHPSSLESGWGRRQTREGKHTRSLSAAAHKALHLLLAFQAPPWASFFRGSRMPPSVVGGTVPPAFAVLPPPP